MQYRKDYADYGEQEIALRRRAQAQLSTEIGRVSEMEQRYLSEMMADRSGSGSGARAYSSQLLGGDGSAAPRGYDEYFEENRRTAAIDAFDRGPTAKRYRGLNEVDAGMGEPNVYRQQQQQYGQQSQPLETYDSYGGGGGLDYGQLTALDAERERYGGGAAINDDRQHFRGIGGNQRQYEQQQSAAPPGYDPGYAGTTSAMGNVAARGGVRTSGGNELDVAERYCRDLFLAEEEESQRRKAAIRAEMEKISAARSVGGVPHQSARMMEDEQFQQRSTMSDSRSWRQPSESMAAAELRSLMSAGRANADEMMESRGIARAPNTKFGVVNAGVLGPWANGGPTPGPELQEKRKEQKRQEPQPIIQTAKASETFFADVRKRPLIGGGGQLIKSQMPMQMQVPMMPMLNPMVSMQMPAFAAQNRMFPARQSQVKVKPAPTNVPSGKVYSKKEKEELENRRHGAELRQLLAAPENAEIWVETHTNEVRKTKQNNPDKEKTVEVSYFFNAVTGETVHRAPTNPTKDGLPVHIVKQEELAKVLARSVPQTIIIKRTKVAKGLTDAMVRAYFEKFGKVALAKVMKLSKRSGGKKGALIRMATIEGQEKVLACKDHIINQQPTEVMISPNRLFISRLPDNCLPSQLMLFLAEQARMLDSDLAPAGVDVYWCTPFPQFGFVTFGGQLIAKKLFQASDLLYKGRFYLNLCGIGVDLNAEANEVYTRKLEEFTEKANSNQKMRQMVKALNSVSETVKLMLEFISESSEQNRDFFTLRSMLAKLNSIFARCTDDETRNYHTAMELIMEMCLDLAHKLGILIDPGEFDSYVAAGALLNQPSKAKGDEGGEDDTIENELEHDATADGTDGGGAEGEGDGTQIEPENAQSESEGKVGIETTTAPPQQ